MKVKLKQVIISLAVSLILISNPAFAVNSFYSGNDILFYDSEDTGCISDSAIYTSPVSKDNQKLVASFLTSTNFAGNGDKPMNAVQMAALMGNMQQESGFRPEAAGSDGSYRGIIQWSSPGRWDNIAEPRTDITNQLNYLKAELDGIYKDRLGEFWNATNPNDLNKATYAITRNYEVAINSGKDSSSTTWTNDSGATANVQDWIKRRGYAIGFYDEYGNMAGSGYTPGPTCGGLISGGMSLEQAKAFMQEYKNLEPKTWPEGTAGTAYELNGTSCAESPLANCVAFSQYFVNRYTTKKLVSPGDGRSTVGELLALDFKDGNNTPRVYAVFSTGAGTHGHTGVVLGIDTDNDKIIIGEAGCGYGLDWIDAREYSLKTFSSGSYTYAYSDEVLKDISL